MTQDTLYVGLDTDKKHLDVAVADELPGGEVRYWGQIANTPVALDRVVKRLRKGDRRLVVCYEAGPCGYGIARRLNAMAQVSCMVVAPALIPRRAGDRVKTNRRDALGLVKLLRAEELTAVWMPDAAHEAMRDVVRARASAVSDVGRCRQRITSFLLRHEIAYGGKGWTKKHRVWLGGLNFAEAAHQLMFAEMLIALDQATARRDRLSELIAELVPGWSLSWLVEALQHLRGFALINAATVVAEIGDPTRFDSPRQLMAYLGLVPSEYSTGETTRRGGLTKTGNIRARRALIEAAWTYTRPRRGSSPASSPEIGVIADKAYHRLSQRYRKLVRRGKRPPVACAAIARELLGFVWAVAHAAQPPKR